MRDVELYQQLLGVVSPWTVNRVELSVEGERSMGRWSTRPMSAGPAGKGNPNIIFPQRHSIPRPASRQRRCNSRERRCFPWMLPFAASDFPRSASRHGREPSPPIGSGQNLSFSRIKLEGAVDRCCWPNAEI